jgi:hypothetical protein
VAKRIYKALAVGIVFGTLVCPHSDANELSLGAEAKSQFPVPVPLNKPTELNFKTLDEILEMRFRALVRTPALLKGSYEPEPAVFERIEDKRPWWGTAGAAIYGAGERSILGPAEESRFILNPLLLVAANSATVGIWRPDRITREDINNPDFPFFWSPEQLQFDPKNSTATVIYNVTDYLSRINATGKLEKPVTTPNFSLVAYNARDFGYNFIYLDVRKSSNISNMHSTYQPARLRQMIHCGGSCGFPGGCNNMSPFIKEIDRLSFTELPAKAVVSLWKEYPGSVERPADFTVIIQLR